MSTNTYDIAAQYAASTVFWGGEQYSEDSRENLTEEEYDFAEWFDFLIEQEDGKH